MKAAARQVIPINSAANSAADGAHPPGFEELRSRLRAGEKAVQLFSALAEESERRGEREEAVTYWNQLLELDPEHPEARPRLAALLLALERWHEAAVHYRRLAESEPASASAWAGHGEALLGQGDYPGALRCFDQALKLAPGDPDALRGRSDAADGLEKHAVDSVLSLWEEAGNGGGAAPEPPPAAAPPGLLENLASGPVEAGLAPIEEGLAAAALGMNDWRGVIHHCSRLVQIAPGHYEAWFNLGVARQHAGEPEEAEFAYRQALKLRPESPAPLINLAIVKYAQGDTEGACEVYREALSVSPSQEQALWNLALLLERSGDAAGAEEAYERLAASHPEHAEGWFRLGFLRLGRGGWDAAAEALARFVSLKPEAWEGAFNLGIAHQRNGNHEAATACFEKSLALQPGHSGALRGLAVSALELGQMDRVVAIRRQLVQLKINGADLTFQVARWLESKGRLDDALKVYADALKERPAFPEALLNLGHLLRRQGKESEANECWRRALHLKPELAARYFDPED